MLQDLTPEQKRLADFMSDISERCYSAGWMKDLEYILWDALLNGERQYGQDTISSIDIEELIGLSNAGDSWIVFSDDNEETAIALNVWKLKFDTDTQQDPSILKGY
jgi:hypothetical protein